MEGSSNKFFSPTNPHFFKPILPGFQSQLSIPKSFLKYLGEDIKEGNGKIATLRNIRVDNKIWWVEVEFDDDDDDDDDDDEMYFRNGWENFYDDHGLQVGDFVLFKHHENLVFDVFILDPSTCERPFPGFRRPSQPSKKVKSSSSKINSANGGISKKMKGLKKAKYKEICSSAAKVNFVPRSYEYFHIFVQPSYLDWGAMTIPKKFAKKNNLANKWCDMTLIDEKGKKWPVHLRNRKDKYGGTYITGWNHKRSGLKGGDPIVFELIEHGENPIMKIYR